MTIYFKDNDSDSNDNKNYMLHIPVMLYPRLSEASSSITNVGTCSSTVKLHVPACEQACVH